MTDLYNAIALQTDTVDCKFDVGDAPNYEPNLRHLEHMIDMAVLHSMEYPPRLIALCEGAIQGFPDEIHDWESAEYARSGAIDIPGPETDRLAEKAVKWNLYLVGQAKARMPEFPDRFFNTGFIIDPTGTVIHQHRKNVVFTIEHTTTPHDVWDQWVAMFGTGLDAFFPVARTPIGNIGCLICMEGNYPEIARGLMMNGAEIIYRPSSIENKISTGIWQIQNQARALDNNAYVVAPNTGYHVIDAAGTRGFVTGGHPMVVDYRGQVLHMIRNQGDAFSAAAINIDGLRQHRAAARHNNWAPHMKTEIFRLVYDKAVWPKNLALDHPPRRREATEGIYFQVIRKLQEDGVQVAPGAPAEPAGPKPVTGQPAAGRPESGPERPSAKDGSLKDYILGRTTRLSGEDDRKEDRDADPLAAE
jgi:predicted amidohydrolase